MEKIDKQVRMTKEQVIKTLENLQRFREINLSDIDALVNTLLPRVKNEPYQGFDKTNAELLEQLKDAETIIGKAMEAYTIGHEAYQYWIRKQRKLGVIG